MPTKVLQHPTSSRTSGSTCSVDRSPVEALFNPKGAVRHFTQGSVILLHGAQADMLYQIVSGTVRCCTISEDGRRQIFRFAHGGDYLGLAEVDFWHYTAEAVDHVIMRSVPRDRVEAALERDTRLQRAVRGLVAEQLAERERQLITLAYMSAEQRLLRFLEAFAARRKSDGFLVLPMTRQDIGDHLGLTLETVSRAFGALKRKDRIEMRGSERFRILDTELPVAA